MGSIAWPRLPIQPEDLRKIRELSGDGGVREAVEVATGANSCAGSGVRVREDTIGERHDGSGARAVFPCYLLLSPVGSLGWGDDYQ